MMADAVKNIFVDEVRLMSNNVLSEESYQGVYDAIEVVSAGEANIICHSASGFSETLDIKSREGDSLLISSHPYTGGYIE